MWRIGIFSGRAVGGLILSVTLQISKSVYGITLTNGCLPTHQINSQQKIWLAKYTKKIREPPRAAASYSWGRLGYGTEFDVSKLRKKKGGGSLADVAHAFLNGVNSNAAVTAK